MWQGCHLMSDRNYSRIPAHSGGDRIIRRRVLPVREESRRQAEDASKAREGTVVAVTTDSVLVDIGYKSEGIFR